MKCEDAQSILTQYLLGDLDEDTCAGIREHLETCESCRAAVQEIEPTLDLLRDALAAASEVPERLSSVHRARVRGATSRRPVRIVWWVAEGHPKLVAAAAVVVIAFILVGTMLPALSGARSKARVAASLSKLRSAEIGLELSDAVDAVPEPVEMEEITAIPVLEKNGNGTVDAEGGAYANGYALRLKENAKGEKSQIIARNGQETVSYYARPGEPESAAVPKAGDVPVTGRLFDGDENGRRSGVSVASGTEVQRESERRRGKKVDDYAWRVAMPVAKEAVPAETVAAAPVPEQPAAPPPPAVPPAKAVPERPAPQPKPKPSAKPTADHALKYDASAQRAVTVATGPVPGPEQVAEEKTDAWFSFTPNAVDETKALAKAKKAAETARDTTTLRVEVSGESRAGAAAGVGGLVVANGSVVNGGDLAVTEDHVVSDHRELRPDEGKGGGGRLASSGEAEVKVTPDADPQPAPFDSVAIVKSPVIMKGIFGARSPGSRGAVVATGTPDVDADAPGDDAVLEVSLPDDGSEKYKKELPETRLAAEREPPKDMPVYASGKPPVAELEKAAGERYGMDKSGPVSDRLVATDVEGTLRRAVGKTRKLTEHASRRYREVDRLEEATKRPEPAVAPKDQDVEALNELYSSLGSKDVNAQIARADVVDETDRQEEDDDKAGLLRSRKRVQADVRKDEPETGPRFKAFGVNPFFSAAERPFSTFAIDVDTAAYTLARNYMLQGLLPPAEAVRTEEFVNFFDYGYEAPRHGLFKVYAEWAPSKFGRGLQMLKIGVKGRRLGREEQRPATLTFVIDSSGSMDKPDRLGLAKKSLRMLVERLGPRDRIAIVQFDSHARLVLEHTPASDKQKILQAIDAVQCGGSTNLEEGMRRAYEVASQGFAGGAENRVLLLSDGVANLGTATATDILKAVESFRKQGVFLSVFGLGMGTYDDEMLETLANRGNGAYAFVDSEEEARRVFVEDMAATLNTIAADVKIQVEFNQARVARYRQLGYENRQLKKEDFRNDAVDAGEVGSGQSVTALYELEERPADSKRRLGETPRPTEQGPSLAGRANRPGEPGTGGMGADVIATVRVRYRRTADGKVVEMEHPVRDIARIDRFDAAPARFKLAACVAEFSEILRGSPFAAGSRFEDVARILRPAALELHLDKRVGELLRMVAGADGMSRAPLSD